MNYEHLILFLGYVDSPITQRNRLLFRQNKKKWKKKPKYIVGGQKSTPNGPVVEKTGSGS